MPILLRLYMDVDRVTSCTRDFSLRHSLFDIRYLDHPFHVGPFQGPSSGHRLCRWLVTRRNNPEEGWVTISTNAARNTEAIFPSSQGYRVALMAEQIRLFKVGIAVERVFVELHAVCCFGIIQLTLFHGMIDPGMQTLQQFIAVELHVAENFGDRVAPDHRL